MSDSHFFVSNSARAKNQTRNTRQPYLMYGKRLFDLCLAIFLFPVLAPLIALICAVVQLDGASGLYRHKRVGRNGRLFECVKIRTMVVNSESRLRQYLASNPKAADEWNAKFKLTNDPRITRLGRVLRATGLDELPQIWNVLCGDMSFVGPRPVTKPELKMYGPHQTAYLSVRPGITGMWQIHGRKSGNYENRVRLDRGYLDRISFRLDVILIGQTALSVVKMTGS